MPAVNVDKSTKAAPPGPASDEKKSTATIAQNVSSKSSPRIESRYPGVIWLVLPFAITFLHVFLSPHTKVEETPALHAVHDILTYGISPAALSQYEHVVYPGAVPRSLIPSLILAGLSKPLISLGTAAGLIKRGLDVQVLVRILLAAIFSTSLAHLTTTLHRISPRSAIAFVLLSITQFHVPYYAARTLPNFLALPLVIIAFSTILRANIDTPTASTGVKGKQLEPVDTKGRKRRLSTALTLVTVAATVIRLEIAPMVIVLALLCLSYGHLSIVQTISAGAIGGFGGLALTALVDGYFYRLSSHPLAWWPELSAFVFNIPQGRAAEWGVMPWYHYIISIARLSLSSLPLALLHPALNTDPRGRKVLAITALPSMALVAALSLVGHKEWRFIVYVVPLINILAAQSASRLWTLTSPFWRGACRLALIGALCGNLAVTCFLTHVSARNYPGGAIGPILEDLTKGQAGAVWVPAAALHTGATVFTLPPTDLDHAKGLNLTIVRPESSYEASFAPSGNSPSELWEEGYDWVVTDDWDLFGDMENGSGRWSVAEEVIGYKGVQLGRRPPFLGIKQGRRLAIMKREA